MLKPEARKSMGKLIERERERGGGGGGIKPQGDGLAKL